MQKIIVSILLLFSIVFSTQAQSKSCSEFYKIDRYTGFTFPDSSQYKHGIFSVGNKACYQGRNISDWVAGDGREITSALIPNPEKTLAIVTVSEPYNEVINAKSSIRVIAITDRPIKLDLLNENYVDDYKKSIYDMRIVGFDQETSTIYFDVPTWATSSSIHSLKLPFDSNYQNLKSNYVTDGALLFVVNGLFSEKYQGYLIVEKSRIEDGKGRVWSTYLISPDGKEICKVDTEKNGWQFNLCT